MRIIHTLLFASLLLFFTFPATAESRILDARLHHLRIDGPREWSDFPEQPEAARLKLNFDAQANASEQTLFLRQQDVKQTWSVLLNGQPLGRLTRDENDMIVCFAVPTGALRDGENVLAIEQSVGRRSTPDDVRVGHIRLDSRPVTAALSEATLEVEVLDADSDRPIPARITILNAEGALQSVGAISNDHLAVRPGAVFTSTGRARIPLPAGSYTLHAGRGFEYSLATKEVTLEVDDTATETLSIRREVPTPGYVACDTHVHTLTHSGHGDATVQERLITLAAEGIELPIATDHNVHIDYEPLARSMNVRQYFTPVIGNEVTTAIGHFNIFPVQAGAPIPNHRLDAWAGILNDIYRTPQVKVAILNHGRDLHGGTRPLGPKLHNALVGENVDGWDWRANAMEVVNSGATQTDVLQLLHDWMGLLNRGRLITPVGGSDSHDVARHFVGQGRTYIRAGDAHPGDIDVEQAVSNFVEGRVLVSYGLLATIRVNGKYGPGDLAMLPDEQVRVEVEVRGPHWVEASHVRLYVNGRLHDEQTIPALQNADLPEGVKWRGGWTLDRPAHDVHLVAIALGPGIDGLYWKTAKSYQPTSPDWEAHTLAATGAVWLDGDGDGRRSAARDYAETRFASSGGDLPKLLQSLAGYDYAVATQAAHLHHTSGRSLLEPAARTALHDANALTQQAFQDYLAAWRETVIARGE